MKWKQQLDGMQAYKPGKPIEEVQAEYGLDSIVKLASNENPLGPSPQAVTAIWWLPQGNSIFTQ